MGNTTNITLFGLGPRVWNQPRIAGPALFRLNASARAAVEILGDKGKRIRRLTKEFIEARRTQNTANALQARQKLERLLAGLSAQEIRAIHYRARGRRAAPAIDRFAPLDPGALKKILAGRGVEELEPSEDRQIAEGGDYQKARQALGRISTAAAFGNLTSFNELNAIAMGSSNMASAARVIVERWDVLAPLTLERDRLSLAIKASAIIQAEYNTILAQLLMGEIHLDKKLAEKLASLADGFIAFIRGIDSARPKSDSSWTDNPEAERLMHNIFGRTLDTFATTASNILDGTSTANVVKGLRYFSLGELHENEIMTVVRSAFLQNALAASANGIQIQFNVPLGILLENQHRKIVESSLTELVYNASKYADEAKTTRWIRVDWDPAQRTLTVVDNGIGIKDTKAIWHGDYREAPDHAPGTGRGLSYVKTQLEAIGWKIEVESKLGEGTVFTLTPPPQGITYSEDYLQSLLAQQRAHLQTHGQFDLATLTPEVVVQMTAEEQTLLGEQLFRQMHQISIDLYEAIHRLRESDIKGLEKLLSSFNQDFKRLTALFFNPENLTLIGPMRWAHFRAKPKPEFLRNLVRTALDKLKKGEVSWQEALSGILHPDQIKPSMFDF